MRSYCNCPDCDLPPWPIVLLFGGVWLPRSKVVKLLRAKGCSKKTALQITRHLERRDMTKAELNTPQLLTKP